LSLRTNSNEMKGTFNGLHGVCRESFAGDVNYSVVILIFHVSDDIKIGQCPGVPCFVPRRVEMRCKHVAVQNVVNVPLRHVNART
jgi:hypothetical protein